MDDLAILNLLVHRYFSDLKGFNPVEFPKEANNSAMLIPTDQEAFTLIPVNSCVRSISGIKSDQGAIYRGLISYTLASRMAKNEHIFVFHMSLALNQALTELTRLIGDLSERKIILSRPGLTNEYFTHVEGAAAYEFRIFVESNYDQFGRLKQRNSND